MQATSDELNTSNLIFAKLLGAWNEDRTFIWFWECLKAKSSGIVPLHVGMQTSVERFCSNENAADHVDYWYTIQYVMRIVLNIHANLEHYAAM